MIHQIENLLKTLNIFCLKDLIDQIASSHDKGHLSEQEKKLATDNVNKEFPQGKE